MEKPWRAAFRTYGPLRLASFRCPRIAREGRCKAHNDVKVTLSNPVTPEELRSHLKAPGLLAKPNPRAIKRKAANGRGSLAPRGPRAGPALRGHAHGGDEGRLRPGARRDARFDIEVEAPFSGAPPAPAKQARGANKPGARSRPPRRAGARAAEAHRGAAPAPVPGAPHRPQPLVRPRARPLGQRAGGAGGERDQERTSCRSGRSTSPRTQLATSGIAEPQALAWLGGRSLTDFLARNHIATDFVTPTRARERARRADASISTRCSARAGAARRCVARRPRRARRAPHAGARHRPRGDGQGEPPGEPGLGDVAGHGQARRGRDVSLRTPEKGEVFAATTDDQGAAEIPADKLDPFGDGKDIRTVPSRRRSSSSARGTTGPYERVHRSSRRAARRRRLPGLQRPTATRSGWSTPIAASTGRARR